MPPFPPAPSPDRLLSLIDRMADQPVAMIVDLVVDRYISGTPKRISREAPVLILRQDSETFVPGGGGNAVANVAALGGRPIPLGVIGDDASGLALLDWFHAHGISTAGIRTHPGYQTPTKTRILGGARHAIKQQIVRFDVEDQATLDDDARAALIEALRAQGPCRAAIFSDYGYGAVDPSLVDAVRTVLGPECPLLGDSRYRLTAFDGLDGATPNAEEAEALLGVALDGPPENLGRHGEQLRTRLGLHHLLITRGSDGMSLFSHDHDAVAHLPVHGTDQVADVTGAGDTVIGTFALALAAGASALEAACLANYAGGIVVMKVGTATLDRDELRAAVTRGHAVLEDLQWVRS